MKFTEGYWERNERANAMYAAQAFIVEKIPYGMKVVAPVRTINDRSGALDVSTITTEFTSDRKDMISVRSYHFEGYETKEPRYELFTDRQETTVEINDDEAVMTAGRMSVRVNRKEFEIIFEANGERLTGIGFRNLGYMQYDRAVSSKFPGKDYMSANYDPYMVTELSLSPGECVYGLGERFTAFVKNGQSVDIWNEDGGTASQMSYKNIPFYMTSKNYGVFTDHTDNVSYEVASEKVENVGISVRGEEIRYHIIYGDTMKDVLVNYTDLTGKPALPPAWSFGLWLSTSFTTDYDEETTSSFIQGMEDREIPLSVFHFDSFWMKDLHWCDFEWDERVFPDVPGMLKRYKEKGLRICLWINPYIAQGTKTFYEARDNGYLLMRTDGKGIKQIDNWQPGMGVVDFTNPAAAAWYQQKLTGLIEMGIDCFKTDFGERIPTDVVYHDGSDPVCMHNYYTYLYNRTVFDLLEEKRGKGEVVLFGRSATAGSQQFPIHWGGDCSATYASMAESLRGGLSLTMSGFGFWSHDIGGFEMTATPDVYKRWMQFGMLSTHSRLHGSKSYRVPWLFDDEASDVCREFTKLKARLMPYLYQASVAAMATGVPVMRSMILEFPDDPAVRYLDMQYMLGENILVAPIFSEDGIAEYYLPEGAWTHLISGEVHNGGKWYKEQYDYFSLPVFVRENTMLAMGTVDDNTDYDYAANAQLQVYEMKDQQETCCEITDTSGAVVFTGSVKRDGANLVITLSDVKDGMSILLKNINNVTAVTGAEVIGSDDGVVLKPLNKHINLNI